MPEYLKKIPMKYYSIVFATDENYADATYVAIYSIIKSRNINAQYVFYIFIRDALSDQMYSLFMNLQNVFVNVEIRIESIICNSNIYTVFDRISPVTFLRLYAPLYVKDDLCLYLDQDILIHGDVAEIFNFPLENNLIAGAENVNVEACFERINSFCGQEILNKTVDKYINAGVILMNLKEMRKQQWQQLIDKLIEKRFPAGDQDVINVACKGRIAYMPVCYNYMIKREILESQPLILHYAGGKKPWSHPYLYGGEQWWQLCQETEVFERVLEKWKIFFYLYFRAGGFMPDSRDKLYRFCSEENNVVIYGAGVIAKRVMKDLKEKKLKVNGIAVADMENNPQEIEGVRVMEVSSYSEKAKKTSILLAVSRDITAISMELYRYGFKRVLPIADLYPA